MADTTVPLLVQCEPNYNTEQRDICWQPTGLCVLWLGTTPLLPAQLVQQISSAAAQTVSSYFFIFFPHGL